ncbi:hypothetical protein EV699_1293 [Plasticicumulans lactativorans]|uniref:Uncharacterized protein n=1 Tax=Plasticicumulans lactativorans TaxID=1133106 RepID=A0A4R2KUF9_9GAMM|nr:hypothetical protein [Plasticicumulans lactativorans]TCO76522.1 hypothetical protein EV699_1293 [Plasticicumulans lactativorans]
MTEADFLNLVMQGAGRGSYEEGWESGAAWEIHAQVVIAAFLRSGYGITDARELAYPGSQEHCDFGFTHDGRKYAVELKVENKKDGKFAGMSLDQAMLTDVNKLHAFNADELWFVVIARSNDAKGRLLATAERGDSWIVDHEGGFLAALCNIKTQPHGLPWARYEKSALKF